MPAQRRQPDRSQVAMRVFGARRWPHAQLGRWHMCCPVKGHATPASELPSYFLVRQVRSHAAASHAQRARGLPPAQHLPRPAHPAPAGSCPAGTRVWPRERHKCSSCWMQGTCHNAASAGRPMPAPGRGPPANRSHGTHLPNPPSPFPTTTITTGTHTITTAHQQQHIHHQNPHPRPPRPVAALPSSHLPSLPIPPHTPPAPP